MWKDIHILLLGEPGVGKTSLILALVTEDFPEEVPGKVEEITIPAEVTPEKVPTYIVDYNESEQTAEYELCEEIGRANVICLVYDLSDLSTLDQVRKRWLPLIREYNMHDENISLPIILVGSKSDLITDSKVYEAMPVMSDFPEIETCIECSAKTMNNVSEMFYFAQKAVLHPTGPLYSPQDGYLKPESRMALTRIFKICDHDNDGMLNDGELNAFQTICFNTPLANHALSDVKNVVKKNCPRGVINDSLTLEGFLYLHLLFIQRGRHETTWAVLRKFGYNDSLEICEEYLCPESVQPPDADSVPQLSENGKNFLIDVFHKFDVDKDGVLNTQELYDLFSVFPYEPWGHDVLSTVCTDSNGSVTLVGFLSQWMLTTYLDVPRTLEHLAYLGYATLQGKLSQDDAVTFVSGKVGGIGREIFTCKVVGCKGVGKSSFLQGLIRTNEDTNSSGDGSNKKKRSSHAASVISINQIHIPRRGQPIFLLLHEVDIADLMAATEGLFMCDIVCLLYDVTDADSFQPCVEAYRRFVMTSPEISCVVIATKSDRKSVRQRCLQQPEEFCVEYHLPPPIPFTTTSKHQDIYDELATLAARPSPPRTSSNNQAGGGSTLMFCLKLGAFFSLTAITGYGVYKYLDAKKLIKT